MKLKIMPIDGSQTFEVDVTKINSEGSICNYVVKHKGYKGFQFDDSDRPKHYKKEFVAAQSFHGYLIPKKGFEVIECYIKIID